MSRCWKGVALAALLALGACAAPQSATEAQGELGQTAASAGQASADAANQTAMTVSAARAMQYDIRKVKEVEAFFDNENKVLEIQ
jgi:hypothetical protein